MIRQSPINKEKMSQKIAVVLFNLGGPDSLDAVRPFLFNLFNDRAILSYPQPFRWILARVISAVRHNKARKIYQILGGKSPLLENTLAQATALEDYLHQIDSASTYKIFIAMRYWHPFTADAVQDVWDFDPDKIILLPLYPQFSRTTTESSLTEWTKQAKKQGLKTPTCSVPFYYNNDVFIKAHSDSILPVYQNALAFGAP
ncbi:MAG: ferrochelatase, partial [Alphaproteobacteria bacterium]|nr:ferrochelatase [Alphaproteobacteria bacterium]